MRRLLFFVLLLGISTLWVEAEQSTVRLLQDRGEGVGVLTRHGTDFAFFMPETAGYWIPGISVGEQSVWLHEAKNVRVRKQNVGWLVEVEDPILGRGVLTMEVLPLSASNGLIARVIGKKIPEGLHVVWAFGGCSASNEASERYNWFQPEQCKDNVFSREINAFTVYYGESMRLRVMMGVMPLDTDLQLSDARTMQSPLAFRNSGKKTPAPALSGMNVLTADVPAYYCIYRQNRSADYNYYKLPEVFEQEKKSIKTKKNEEADAHTSFGPDFHF